MGVKQILLHLIKVDLGVMALKKYFTLPWSLELKLHHQMQFSVIHRIPLFEKGSYCCIAVIHIQLYTYTCGNKINEHTSLEKIYLSHFIHNGWKGLCVRGELETGQTATYWPQVPLSLAALLSHSAGLLNRGSWGPKPPTPCWELVLTASNCNSNFNCYSLQLTQLSVAPGYIIVWHPPASCGVAIAPNSTRPRSRWYPDIFDRMHLLFTQEHLLFDSAGEGKNMQHYFSVGDTNSVFSTVADKTVEFRRWSIVCYYPWKLHVFNFYFLFLKATGIGMKKWM